MQGMIEILDRAVGRHPKTTFIACHFANCCYDLSRLGEMLDKYPNLYADISARYAETAAIPRFVGQFYERYQDRLVYGTDMGAQRGHVPASRSASSNRRTSTSTPGATPATTGRSTAWP